MEKFIQHQLNIIEQSARQIASAIHGIYGYCAGMETVANDYSNIPQEQLNQESNGYQKIVSNTTTVSKKTVEEIIREVQEMIIELQIKGSVREHRDGLLKFTSTLFSKPVYGRTKEEIEKKLREQLKQLKSKPQKDKKTKNAPLLSEFYRTEYLPYKIGDGIAESTIEGYEFNLRFIINQKFDKPLNLYKSKDIVNFLYSFPQTRKRQIIQGFLNNVFNRAITAAYIKSNPCNTIEKVKHKQEQGTSFSFTELKEFLQILFSHQHLSYADKCYFIFVFLTGTRREEARQINVKDVDFRNKVLHIPGTKTNSSDRDIPLNNIVEKLLRSMNIIEGNYFNITESMTNHYFRTVWKKEKGHKLHDLRHTFGTIQICVNKIDVKTVSIWMGHSTIDTTLRIYTHPEQLDKGTFLNGSLTENDKNTIYNEKYREILDSIDEFIKF